MNDFVKSLVKKMPVIGKRYQYYVDNYENSCFHPGHYYSPIVNVAAVKQEAAAIWSPRQSNTIDGVDLNTDKQLALLQDLASYYPEMPFKADKQPGLRYYFNNDLFTQTDGTILYAMMRHFKPKQIIEAGSGHTSALMLDVNDKFFNKEIKFTFIDPEPQRLLSLLTPEDKKQTEIHESIVQNISIDKFRTLQENDILFIDGSHVSKCNSDVNYVLFNILPALNKGVIIHIHDVFYPFEYPQKWVFEGRNWNENYILRAFLMYNSAFEIIHFSDYLQVHYPDAFAAMPVTYEASGGNIWLRKR